MQQNDMQGRGEGQRATPGHGEVQYDHTRKRPMARTPEGGQLMITSLSEVPQMPRKFSRNLNASFDEQRQAHAKPMMKGGFDYQPMNTPQQTNHNYEPYQPQEFEYHNREQPQQYQYQNRQGHYQTYPPAQHHQNTDRRNEHQQKLNQQGPPQQTPQPEFQSNTIATMRDEDDLMQTFIKIVPDPECETNPNPEDMTQLEAVLVALEFKARGMKKGIPSRLFSTLATIPIKDQINQFLMPHPDPATAREIIQRILHTFEVTPPNGSYAYVFSCSISEGTITKGGTRGPKPPTIRNVGEELSIAVNLGVKWHGDIDASHITIPFEEMGCDVKLVYFPKTKFRGARTSERAAEVIVKVSPPYHTFNTKYPGPLNLEDSGRRTKWPRRITIICPYGGEILKHEANYFIYDHQSNPSCDLQLCRKCHQPMETGHASDCPTLTYARREHKQAAKEQERIVKGMFANISKAVSYTHLTLPTMIRV